MQNLSGRMTHRSTRTWTASSAERELLNDNDEVENRGAFVQEYNRLAKKVRNQPTMFLQRLVADAGGVESMA